MTTTTTNSTHVDITKGAKYPVVVSERLLQQSGSSQWNLASVQLNHKPTLSNPYPPSSITAADSGGDNCNFQLSSDDQQSSYLYTGSQLPSTACALIFNPSTQTFTLDKIDTDFTFNLRSTPTNKRPKSLATIYPQLETTAPDPASSSSEDDPFSIADDTVADPDNPYDYRHFIKRRRTSSPEAVTIGSPSIPAPVRRPSKTRPKQRPHHRPPPKRPSPTREEADADNEDSDDGGLTIDMGGDTKPRHRLNDFAHIDRTGSGPISLRSAASSASPPARQSPYHLRKEEESSEESDEDVSDEMQLPPPFTKTPTPVEMHEEEEDDEDEGDLEAELQRELEKANGEEESGRYVQESSSESEEE